MAEDHDPGTEFGRIVDCAQLGRSIETHRIEADKNESKALADRLDIPDIEALSAKIDVSRTSEGLIRLNGKLEARYVQNCIVTLEPVQQEVNEDFELFFKEVAEGEGSHKVDVPIENDLSPEPFEQGRIDIGEAVSQQLALALDPYPRAPGAVFEAAAGSDTVAEPRVNPLAEIGNLLPFERQEDGKK